MKRYTRFYIFILAFSIIGCYFQSNKGDPYYLDMIYGLENGKWKLISINNIHQENVTILYFKNLMGQYQMYEYSQINYNPKDSLQILSNSVNSSEKTMLANYRNGIIRKYWIIDQNFTKLQATGYVTSLSGPSDTLTYYYEKVQ